MRAPVKQYLFVVLIFFTLCAKPGFAEVRAISGNEAPYHGSTNPEGTFAHNNLALIYEMQKKTSDAVAEYKILNKLNPSDPEAFYGLGVTYLDAGNYADAITNAKEAVRLYQLNKSSLLGDGEELLRGCLP
ncbi:MAG: tetratricopeptide repeat protein [Chthoniobacterales bacterium]